MIESLHIKNLALIKEAEMYFPSGLIVLTGETGAGKTALLGAIRLATGQRADLDQIRDGEDQINIEAEFSLTPKLIDDLVKIGILDGEEFYQDSDSTNLQVKSGTTASQNLNDNNLQDDSGRTVSQNLSEQTTLIVKRKVSGDGRSRCYLNDELVKVGTLSNIVGSLVEIHGQHDQQVLMNSASHLGFLDRWGSSSIEPAKKKYLTAYRRYQDACDILQKLQEAASMSSYQLEQAQFICQEISKIHPQAGELDELERSLPILRSGEALAKAAADVLYAIRSDEGVLDYLHRARESLNRVMGTDPKLDKLYQRIESAEIDIEDIAMELSAYADSVEFDPQALENALNRLGELDGLVKRFGPTYDEMLKRWDDAVKIVEQSKSNPDEIQNAKKRVEESAQALKDAGSVLQQARLKASKQLAEKLSESAADLAMPSCSFSFDVEEFDFDSWTTKGPAKFELTYSPGKSIAYRALSRIASGGELSRVMLALESVLDDQNSSRTMIFDEVDAGVGGAAATSVAQRLGQLSQNHQVIVVTHLAQIAAQASSHFLVEKITDEQDGAPVTTIREISGDERVKEIARMLAGTDNEIAIEHARSLLEQSELSE